MKKNIRNAILFVIFANMIILIDQTKAQSIWAVGNTEKITPDAPVQNDNFIWSGTGKLVSIKAAKNEHEPFQLVIFANSRALSNVNVSISDLTSSSGGSDVIAADNITLYREVFINVTKKSRYPGHPVLGSTGKIPDALVPFKDPYGSAATPGAPFNVPQGENQPIWIDVYIPSETQASRYSGSIMIKEGNTTIETITLIVDVWNFEIPMERHLKCVYDFMNDFESIYSELYGEIKISDELMENQYRALADRRLGALNIHQRPAYDDGTGFDWTNVELLYNRLINQYHFSVLNMPRIYYDAKFEDSGEVWWEEQYAIKKPNGTPYQEADFTPGSDFMNKAALYYQYLYDDFSSRGWIDKHFVMFDDESGHVSDEPYNIGLEGYQRVKQWSNILHNVNPNLLFLLAGESIIPSAAFEDTRGYTDIWDMYMDEIQQNAQIYQERLAAYPDEQLWMVPNSYADFIDYPAIYHRILGWFAYKYNVTGVELWAVYAWLDENEAYYDPWQITGSPDNAFGFGGGALFYPGHNIENRGINIQGPVTSIRMELNREAMEDYEYLYLLEQSGSRYGKSMANKIIPSELYYGISTQPEDFYSARETIGSILNREVGVATATISGTVKDYQSVAISGAVVTTDGAAGITNANGFFIFTVMPGTYIIKASAREYLSGTQPVNVVSNESRTDVNFTLTPAPWKSQMLFNSFENLSDLWTESEGVLIEKSSAHVTDGLYSMKVTFDENYEEPYVGMEFDSPQNWTDYTGLELDIYNDSQYRSMLDIEIYDSNWATVFERTVSLSPYQWNYVRVPIDNAFSSVFAMELYVNNYGRTNREIFFDTFRLINEEITSSVKNRTSGAMGYFLYQNFPNPFNPETIIGYQIAKKAFVKVKIFNVLGQEIKTIAEEQKGAGYHTALWDGKDNQGKQSASGVYVFEMAANSGQDFFCEKKKMLLLR